MNFSRNLHNPIPLHTSKELWYSRARHAESHVDYFPVLPLNTIPRFQLTCSDYPTAYQRSATTKIYMYLNASVSGQSIARWLTLNGTVQGQLTDAGVCTMRGNLQVSGDDSTVRTDIVIQQLSNSTKYSISVNGAYVMVPYMTTYRVAQFNKATIEAGFSNESFDFGFVAGNSFERLGTLVSLSAIDLDYTGSNTHSYTVNVHRYEDDAIVHTLTGSAKFTLVPPEFMSDAIRSFVAIGGDAVVSATTKVGPHYIELIIDSNIWYSEPFCWVDNLHDYIQVRYRRTSPIITVDNYIAFVDQNGNDIYATMYLPTTLLAPPYQFDPTVVEIDGYKFVQKLVSYRSEKMEFFCTGYFAEAIRTLWHCNVRTISQLPEPQRIVDYMEPPEINWDNDTHYCSAAITFNTDTIMQTNGNVELDLSDVVMNHQSYDASFNNSFN